MRLSDAWLPPCGTTLPHIPNALNLVTRDMERSILRYSPLLWSDATTPRTDKPVRFRVDGGHWLWDGSYEPRWTCIA